MDKKSNRILWLINHTTLREFEIRQLIELGYEVFVPKSFPYDEGNLSASVSYEFDSRLSIPYSDLEVLNTADWYGDPNDNVWNIANKYFSKIFFAFFPSQLRSVVRNFHGDCILRPFGLAKGVTYSQLIEQELGPSFGTELRRLGERFWFGEAYAHLHEIEDDFLKKRAIHLPVGLKDVEIHDDWVGDEAKIFFVCPRIGSSPYYNRVYQTFVNDFKPMPYVIGGAQPISVPDKKVAGFVSRERYDGFMKGLRVMFYHSQEPNHLHYHPFEAVRCGMPLVFMGGGMLDSLGGHNLPGRCKSIKEARYKIERVLFGDKKLIDSIKNEQTVLLDSMSKKTCAPIWRQGIKRIEQVSSRRQSFPLANQPRIAVMLPVAYRGGSMRAAISLAKMFSVASKLSGKAAEVIFAAPTECLEKDEQILDLKANGIKVRSFSWKKLSWDTAKAALCMEGCVNPPLQQEYIVPDDGVNNFLDCDFWFFISDRVPAPLLPIRKYGMIVYDYLQRYVEGFSVPNNEQQIDIVRRAEFVLATTDFTVKDLQQYAGVEKSKVFKVPMAIPTMKGVGQGGRKESNYFLWPTNVACHKNHVNAMKAILKYYESLGGNLECRVCGVDSQLLLEKNVQIGHVLEARDILNSSQRSRMKVQVLGELSEDEYWRQLRDAKFLWHPAAVDNGTFCVLEAASQMVPSLSSDYPAMREIDEIFGVNMLFCDSTSPSDMSQKLKYMEEHACERVKSLPDVKSLHRYSWESCSQAYWEVINKCL